MGAVNADKRRDVVWLVMQEAEEADKKAKRKEVRLAKAAREKMRQEIRREAGVALDS